MEKKLTSIDKVQREIKLCAVCPMMCKSVCTVHVETKREADQPSARALYLLLAQKGVLKLDEDLAGLMYQGCSLCRNCMEYCATRQDIPKYMVPAREDAVNLGVAPKAVMEIGVNIDESKNPFNEPAEKRFAGIKNLPKKSKAGVVYFAGCTTEYNHPEIADSVVKILNAAKIDFTVMDDEWCCGLPAYDLGLRETATKMAKHNADSLIKTGCKTLLTSCPACYYMLKNIYAEWGVPLNVEVVHHSEYIKKLIKDGRLSLKNKVPLTATYMDPCLLGRYMEVYDAPREVLKKVPQLKFNEMHFNREKALCCGAGGGLKTTNPIASIKASEKVVDEVIRAKAKTLIVACPECKQQFVAPILEKGLKLYDIAEIVAKAL